MRVKAVMLLCGVVLFTGCMDFTRYKTGKVLEQGKVRLTLGEGLGLYGEGEGIGTILPKVGVSAGLGKGLEVGCMTNVMVLGGDIRQQVMYEEENGVNATIDLGVNSGMTTSINGGFTLSKTTDSKKEPYFGVRYNKYFNNYYEDDELFDEIEKLSNIQTTVGIKLPISRFAVYPELNFYKFTEEEGIITIMGIGTTFEF